MTDTEKDGKTENEDYPLLFIKKLREKELKKEEKLIEEKQPTEERMWSKGKSIIICIFLILLFFTCSTLFYHFAEEWSVLDAVYFSSMVRLFSSFYPKNSVVYQ